MPQVDYVIVARPTRVQRFWNWVGIHLVNAGLWFIWIGAWCLGIDTGEIKIVEVAGDES